MLYLKNLMSGRPVWMNAVMLFCAYMTFIYMPFDLFVKPVEQDQEVWFGFMLTGWWAKATAPLHWLIYGAGLYGFVKMKSWMWPWASLYVLQVAVGMLVWSLMDDHGRWQFGLVAFLAFFALAFAFWRARAVFQPTPEAEIVLPNGE